jgi:hypothetical protein
MPFHRLRQPLLLWLALLIAVFGALVHGGAASMVEVCGASGRHWVDARGVADGSPDTIADQQSTLMLDQCPFCRILQHQGVGLVSALVMPQMPSVSPAPIPVVQTVFFVASIKSTNLPRGPPATA